MSSITEQFSAATKSQWETQFNIFSTFASTAVESAEKVIALNISTTRASVEKSSAAAKKLLEAKDPKEFFSLSTAEPASFDGLLAYGRQLVAIATDAQSELIQSAQSTIKQVTELSTAPVTATVKTAAKATPPALAAAVSAAVAPPAAPVPAIADTAPVVAATTIAPANEAVAVPAAPKSPAKVAKPKAAAAPVAEAADVIEVKVAAKPSFPAPPPKPVAAEGKPALKSVEAPKARQAAKPAGKQLDMLSGAKAKK